MSFAFFVSIRFIRSDRFYFFVVVCFVVSFFIFLPIRLWFVPAPSGLFWSACFSVATCVLCPVTTWCFVLFCSFFSVAMLLSRVKALTLLSSYPDWAL